MTVLKNIQASNSLDSERCKITNSILWAITCFDVKEGGIKVILAFQCEWAHVPSNSLWHLFINHMKLFVIHKRSLWYDDAMKNMKEFGVI